jgi:hypothetical protein
MNCPHPLDFETLVAYWLGELPGDREAMLEEHLFGCAQCNRRLERLAALASGVRAVVRNGTVSLAVSEPFVETMQQAGLNVREYRLGPGGSVTCTIGAADDAVISRLRAPLAGVQRLDVVSTINEESEMRLADVPFNPETGEVLLIPSPAWLKTMPAFTMQMRLVSVGDSGEKQLGVYTFNHTPS